MEKSLRERALEYALNRHPANVPIQILLEEAQIMINFINAEETKRVNESTTKVQS